MTRFGVLDDVRGVMRSRARAVWSVLPWALAVSGCFPDDALKAPRRDAATSDFVDVPREGPDVPMIDAQTPPVDASDLDADARDLDAPDDAASDVSTVDDAPDGDLDAGPCALAPRASVPSNLVLSGFTGARDFVFDGQGGVVAAVGSVARLSRGGVNVPIATVPSGEIVSLRYTRAGHLVLAAVATNDAGMSTGAIYVVPRDTTSVIARRTGLVRPGGLAVDADDNVWFSDTAGGGVWRMSAMGADEPMRVVADVGSPGLLTFDGDGRVLYVVNTSTTTIYRVALTRADGLLTAEGPAESWYSVATTAVLGLAVDECGALYVGDEARNLILRREPAGREMVRLVEGVTTPRGLVFGVGGAFDLRTLYTVTPESGQLRGANAVVRGVALPTGS